MKKCKRFKIGFVGSCCCHILLIVVVGVFGLWHTAKNHHDDIMAVNLVGGGGGGGNAEAADQLISNVERIVLPDDIIDSRKVKVAEEIMKRDLNKRELEDRAANTAANSATNSAGSGGGIGPGSGGGSGGGHGTGKGAGIGDGSGTGYGGGEGQPVVPPRLVHFAKPEYPSAARQSGVEGTVIVRVLVDLNGDVAMSDVYESSGSNILDEKAASSANEWEFAPAKDKLGRNMKCYVFVPINFCLR